MKVFKIVCTNDTCEIPPSPTSFRDFCLFCKYCEVELVDEEG